MHSMGQSRINCQAAFGRTKVHHMLMHPLGHISMATTAANVTTDATKTLVIAALSPLVANQAPLPICILMILAAHQSPSIFFIALKL
jgi:hypothetical protein